MDPDGTHSPQRSDVNAKFLRIWGCCQQMSAKFIFGWNIPWPHGQLYGHGSGRHFFKQKGFGSYFAHLGLLTCFSSWDLVEKTWMKLAKQFQITSNTFNAVYKHFHDILDIYGWAASQQTVTFIDTHSKVVM